MYIHELKFSLQGLDPACSRLYQPPSLCHVSSLRRLRLSCSRLLSAISTHMHTYKYTCTYIFAKKKTHTYIYTCVYIYVHIHICIYICIYVYYQSARPQTASNTRNALVGVVLLLGPSDVSKVASQWNQDSQISQPAKAAKAVETPSCLIFHNMPKRPRQSRHHLASFCIICQSSQGSRDTILLHFS